jgi:predicted nucleotidyltransferase
MLTSIAVSSEFQNDVDRHVERLLDDLAREHGSRLVSFVVFGSVARGEARPGSDVDLLIVFDDLPRGRHERFLLFHAALERRREACGPLRAAGGYFDWSPLIVTREEARQRPPLFLDMVHDARMLLDRDGFFADVLRGLRERMAELGTRRVRLPDGSWYWDLKPDWKPGEVVEL